MEGERARVFQAERTASRGEGGVLKGDTITPALETLGEKTVCLALGMGVVMYL